MVVDMSNRTNLFVVGLSHFSSKESKVAMLKDNMIIARLMIPVQ